MKAKPIYAEAVETLTTLFAVLGILLCLQVGLLNRAQDEHEAFAAAQEMCCEHVDFPHHGHTKLPALPAYSCGEAYFQQLTPKFFPAAAAVCDQQGLLLLSRWLSSNPSLPATIAAALPVQRHILFRCLLI